MAHLRINLKIVSVNLGPGFKRLSSISMQQHNPYKASTRHGSECSTVPIQVASTRRDGYVYCLWLDENHKVKKCKNHGRFLL